MSRLYFINKEQVIPAEYKPTQHIILCGNEVSNYQYLFSDGGFYPILIGQGEIPRIWLFAKTSKQEVITLIKDSVSNINQIKIDIQNSEKTIEIKDIQNGITILKLQYDSVPIINHLDLKPLGYNISGDSSGLMIGGTLLSGNTFNNVSVIVAFGTEESQKSSPNKV